MTIELPLLPKIYEKFILEFGPSFKKFVDSRVKNNLPSVERNYDYGSCNVYAVGKNKNSLCITMRTTKAATYFHKAMQFFRLASTRNIDGVKPDFCVYPYESEEYVKLKNLFNQARKWNRILKYDIKSYGVKLCFTINGSPRWVQILEPFADLYQHVELANNNSNSVKWSNNDASWTSLVTTICGRPKGRGKIIFYDYENLAWKFVKRSNNNLKRKTDAINEAHAKVSNIKEFGSQQVALEMNV